MCGIYSHLHFRGSRPDDENAKIPKEYTKHRVLSARGPDEHRTVATDNYQCEFHRLAIVGSDGHQPFSHAGVICMVNGEIYNHEELARIYEIQCATKSDCEIVMHLYIKLGMQKTLSLLDGEFAIVLIDTSTKTTYAARDMTGVKPLYYSMDADAEGFTYEIASMISAIENPVNVTHIEPGTMYVFTRRTIRMKSIAYYNDLSSEKISHVEIYGMLQKAIAKRIIHSDRPVGFLLSGGLDSSIVLAMALDSGLLAHPPHVFTYGFDEKAPDVQSARIMVDHLRRVHGDDCIHYHRIIESVKDGIREIPNVIKATETFDTTTIRASTPMKRLCAWIRENTDVRVILSGEGSDELFGGYLYNMYAPDDDAFVREIQLRLRELYMFDNLRADRCSAAHGLEIRPPFLDSTLILNVQRSGLLKRPTNITKPLLRDCIRAFGRDLLPQEILEGRKEAFSDAVGLSWKKELEIYASKFDFHVDCPLQVTSKTTEYFQFLFEQHFGKNLWYILPHYWVPNQDWIDTKGESSATCLPIY